MKPDCDEGAAALDRLLALREGKPLILATVPWRGGCADTFNKTMRERCTGACILLTLEGELDPITLHQPQAYHVKLVDHLYARQR